MSVLVVVVFMFIVFGHLYDVCELYIVIGMVPQLYGLLLLYSLVIGRGYVTWICGGCCVQIDLQVCQLVGCLFEHVILLLSALCILSLVYDLVYLNSLGP